MKHIKDNLPLILLLSVVPYFFYNSPSLSQAIIAASLAALVGFKYHLEYNSQPNYRELFKDDIQKRDIAIKAHVSELIKELEELREKQSFKGIAEVTKKKRDAVNW